jgi:signal transduction histidine kinase
VKLPSPASTRSYVLPAVTAGLAIGIFVADSVTEAEIDVSVLYVGIVLLSSRFHRRRGILIVGLGCMVLTVLSLLLADLPALGDRPSAIELDNFRDALANSLLSIATIGVTTFLIIRTKQAEEELLRARADLTHVARVTTVGELTAAIAHEINQPLSGVVTSANAGLRWLAGEAPDLEAARRSVERIVRDANRASEVISRIRDLIKKSPPQSDQLNINDLILEVIALVRSDVERNRISLETKLSNDLPLIAGDRIQLQQVLLNLIMNAVEALSEVRHVQRELLVSSAREGSNAVLVAVQDSGKGLDRAALARLFEAFYTTKPEGLGMGLAISRTIIEAHGGRLWATPNSPEGAVFQFTVPIDGEMPASSGHIQSPSAARVP